MSAATPGMPATDGEPDAAVLDLTRQRGITEVLHFTTHPSGVTGICATGVVLSSDRLNMEAMVEHILFNNCSNRLKDADWTGYVNLSISRVNKHMLDTSQGWHRTKDLFWVVLAFDPVIMSHPGVTFTTTNNTYQASVRRAGGVDGLQALFAPSVEWGHYGTKQYRNQTMPASWTTDPQAEVLYPDALSLEHLRAVYVHDEDQIDQLHSITRIFPATTSTPVLAKPEVFQ